MKYEGKCWMCRGPGVVTRQTQIRRQLGIFPQLQLPGPEPDAGHLVLPVGPLHFNSTGGIILHTEKNMENLRGRSNCLIWQANLILRNFYECHFSPGKDARRLVILKGDLENSGDRGSLVKEDIAKKYISYFHSILHHNNGYFCLVTSTYFTGVYDQLFFSVSAV